MESCLTQPTGGVRFQTQQLLFTSYSKGNVRVEAGVFFLLFQEQYAILKTWIGVSPIGTRSR